MTSLINISKSFDDAIILRDLTLNFPAGQITTILGPSGCGKSTLLNIVTGLEEYDSGQIVFNGSPTLGYMMQDDLLLPWRTLEQNLTLGLEVLKGNQAKKTDLLRNFIEDFDLDGYEDYLPESLSGGMKQRTALIRTLACKPDLLLLDEPFSNLDFDIKLKIQRNILAYSHQNDSTVVLVTHDIEDAIALSDNVIVLSDKPTQVKSNLSIDLSLDKKDPVEARKSAKFREYFILIWDELKYLDNQDDK